MKRSYISRQLNLSAYRLKLLPTYVSLPFLGLRYFAGRRGRGPSLFLLAHWTLPKLLRLLQPNFRLGKGHERVQATYPCAPLSAPAFDQPSFFFSPSASNDAPRLLVPACIAVYRLLRFFFSSGVRSSFLFLILSRTLARLPRSYLEVMFSSELRWHCGISKL